MIPALRRLALHLVALVLALHPTAAPAALAPAERASPAAGGCRVARTVADGERTLTFDGEARSYLLRLPRGYEGRRAHPLILSFHGHGGAKERHDANTGLSAAAAARGYVVVTPGSLPPNWNIREEPGRARDFAFIEALLAELDRTLCLDRDRIYAAGHSNGAAFAGLLACRPPYRFAAVAMVAGTPPLTCPPQVAPPTLFVRGTADRTVPYDAGVLGGAVGSTARYAQAYGCRPSPIRERRMSGVERLRHTDCRGGGEVVLDTVEGGVHVWPGGPRAAQRPDNSEAGRRYPATGAVLDFFDHHRGRPWTRSDGSPGL